MGKKKLQLLVLSVSQQLKLSSQNWNEEEEDVASICLDNNKLQLVQCPLCKRCGCLVRRKMSGVCSFSFVQDMIEEHLQPYTTERLISQLSKEEEKALIISLSQVLQRIRLCTLVLDTSSQKQVGSESPDKAENLGGFDLHSVDNQRLCKILTDLVAFLTFENQHIQHLTGSVLLAISEFTCASANNFGVFIHLLFLCAESSVIKVLSHYSTKEQDVSNSGVLESYVIAINSRMRLANWSSVAGLSRVLLSVWKYLKQESDDQLVQVFLNSLNLFLTKVPFSLLDDIYVGGNGSQKQSGAEILFLGNRLRPQLVFLGYFVQLLCSVVGLMASLEVQKSSFSSHPAIFSTINLVPKIMCWCLSGHKEEGNTCITTYFRHKLLMLMMRLSLQNQLQCTMFNSWLGLLCDYFQEFLSEQIVSEETVQDNCLDSPFASWISDEKIKALHSLHIRRKATFLFLRCSLVLINLEEETDIQCGCAVTKLQSDLDIKCCNYKKGLVQLCQWLRNNLPAYNFSNSGLYWRECLCFTSSFLKLFMHEDDLLFKVLLQMLQLPSNSSRKLDKERQIPDVDEDFLFHVTQLFNPISLFHVFLAEIHYDHQVLIDYLISKESGTSCAEYLLRCLRIIIASLPAFIDFPIANLCFKRRKITSQDSNEETEMLAVSACEADRINLRGDYRGNKEYGDNSKGRSFEEAKQCLFALKDSVESLHQKNLFPYNPKVLLKRLTEFEHIC